MGKNVRWHKHRFGFIMQSFKVEKLEVREDLTKAAN